jgi:hypothetical protein
MNPGSGVLEVLNVDNQDSVAEGRSRILEGERLPSWRTEPRLFFCRGCGVRVEDTNVPRGWYILTRSSGAISRSVRLGLYCSASCLINQGQRLEGIEAQLGDNWDSAPSPYRN